MQKRHAPQRYLLALVKTRRQNRVKDSTFCDYVGEVSRRMPADLQPLVN